jgi:two-component system LytT family sensor kinase
MFERTRHWIVYGAIWALSALYFTTWDVVYFRQSFLTVLPLNLAQHCIWALEGLLILRLARRFPIESLSPKAWRAWSLNLGAGILFALIGLGSAWLLAIVFQWPELRQAAHPGWVQKSLLKFFSMYFQPVLLIMWAVLGAYHVVRMNHRMRMQELEAAQLQGSLVQARLQALQSQLQPHFLFNTLHSISALIHLEPESADRMVTRLADLLRLTLDTSVEQCIPLKKEIAVIEGYLAIEKVRFQERLDIRIEIPSDLAEARVPSFILQPIVENAIKHGISTVARGGHLGIRASRDGEWLVLEVQDDGAGFQPEHEGIGLANTRSRLALMYKDRQKLEIFSVRDKGTRVIIRIPVE